MGSLLIVGLSGRHASDDWRPLVEGRQLVARSSALARAALPAEYTLAEAFDALFDCQPVDTIVDRVVGRVTERLRHADVAYLVGGPGNLGDATVSRLAE